MDEQNSAIRRKKFIDEKLIKTFLARLKSQIKVDVLVVFGSRARGDAYLTSDYDIAVVSENFQEINKLERIFLLLENWDADFALEPVSYTQAEFMKAKGLLVWDILEEGIIIEDSGLFSERKALHEQMKKAGQLKKVEGGWKLAIA